MIPSPESIFKRRCGRYTLDQLAASAEMTQADRLRFARRLWKFLGEVREGKALSILREAKGGRVYVLSRARKEKKVRYKKFVPPVNLPFARGAKKAVSAAVKSLRVPGSDRPCIAIVGPAGSGKGLLMRALLEHFYGDAVSMILPGREEELCRLLPCILGSEYVWFDSVRKPIDSPALTMFLTAEQWRYRPLGTQEMATFPIRTRVFISGSEDCISPDLARRAIVIQLAGGAK